MIEYDLNIYRIGIFRIHFKDMIFKWGDHQNRNLNIIVRMNTLKKSMENGLYRTDIHHRMSDMITRIKIEKYMISPE